jgi:hypothetical protein
MALFDSADAAVRLSRLRHPRPVPLGGAPFLVWAGYTDQNNEGEYVDLYNGTSPPRIANCLSGLKEYLEAMELKRLLSPENVTPNVREIQQNNLT